MSVLHDAKEFAIKKHGDQMYGDEPYSYHLEETVKVAERHCLHIDIRTAAWLHDILEDTNITYVELCVFFNHRVAGLVSLVTDQPGKNRRERAKKTLPRIRSDPAAVALKLCDRVANVKACLAGVGNTKLFYVYQKEYKAFREALWREGEEELEGLWQELEKLVESTSP